MNRRNNRECSRVRSNRMCQYPLTLNYFTLRNGLTSEWIIRLIYLYWHWYLKSCWINLTLSQSHIQRLIWTLTHWLNSHIRLAPLQWIDYVELIGKKNESTIFFFFIIIKYELFLYHIKCTLLLATLSDIKYEHFFYNNMETHL
jgi:hypothetical protein